MIDWLSETFGLLFDGSNLVITAVFRLAVVAVGLAITWGYIRAVIKDPVTIIRGTLAIITAICVGFGSILFIPKYFEVPIILLWIGGWVAAYFLAMFIGGWKDEITDTKTKENSE